jgi:hypothetical protein
VALVRTDVSEEPGSSFIRVTKIGELGTTQAATSNRRTYYNYVTKFKYCNNINILLLICLVNYVEIKGRKREESG